MRRYSMQYAQHAKYAQEQKGDSANQVSKSEEVASHFKGTTDAVWSAHQRACFLLPQAHYESSTSTFKHPDG